MIKKHHIHLVKNGRISMAGVNTKNVNYIADAIKDAVTNSKWVNMYVNIKISYKHKININSFITQHIY